jgi:exodeoxyribonuclease VII small subunit
MPRAPGLQSRFDSNWRRSVAKSTRKQPEQDFSRFEASLEELEKIVERMESGDQSLEESLKDFERGVTLTRACQSMLKNAEQKVEKLVQDHGELKTEPFADDNDS